MVRKVVGALSELDQEKYKQVFDPETFYHGASDGVSVGTIALYDKLGRIGTSTVCGLAQMKG